MKTKSVLFLMVLFSISAIRCKKEKDPSPQVSYQVSYQISCTDCYVYCKGANGSAQNFYHQNSSWTYSYEAGPNDTLVLIAQNTSGAPASVAGAIRVNGNIVAADTSYCPVSGLIIVSDTLR
ncbi:MAG: hypothetical protein ACKO1U_07230 [Bacteroidota bacterium]